MLSAAEHGHGEAGLRSYAQHWSDPDAFVAWVREIVRMTPDEWLQHNREILRPPLILGLIRYQQYTLVIFQHVVQDAKTCEESSKPLGICMVKKGSTYVVDEEAKRNVPVLRAMHEAGYATLEQ